MTTLHHLALAADWEAAVATGQDRVSTVGRALDDEGFIHAALPEQGAATYERFYARRDDVLMLTIDSSQLTSPWRLDQVGDERFPHVYGPLDVAAVIAVEPYQPRGGA